MSDGLIIALALALVVLGRRRNEPSGEWPSGWTWPVPDLVVKGVRWPSEISQEYRDTATHAHLGVDIMFRSPSPPPTYSVPNGVEVPIVAARAGTLWSVSLSPRGWQVVIDHGPPWATYYQHLSSIDPVLVAASAAGQTGEARSAAPLQLAAGQRLGVMGYDPLDGNRVVHLHFAVWYGGAGDSASIDPRKAMSKWPKQTFMIP